MKKKLQTHCIACETKLTEEKNGPIVYLVCNNCNLVLDYYLIELKKAS